MPSNRKITRIEISPSSAIPPSKTIRAVYTDTTTGEEGQDVIIVPDTELVESADVEAALLAYDDELNFDL